MNSFSLTRPIHNFNARHGHLDIVYMHPEGHRRHLPRAHAHGGAWLVIWVGSLDGVEFGFENEEGEAGGGGGKAREDREDRESWMF